MNFEVQHVLIFALIGFVAFILGVLAFVPIPQDNRDMFIQTVASIIGILTLVAGYYWGKSRNSPKGGDQ